MALTAYLAAVNRLLQNPVPANPLYSTADLTAYINTARSQLAGDAQCVRASSFAALTAAQQLYPFSMFTTFPRIGVASGTIFFSANPSPAATITLNGIVWTFVASGAVGNQTNIGGTTAFTIQQLVFDLTASVNASLTVARYDISGGPSTATLIITYKTAGTAGNAYTLAASVATPSNGTLTGGAVNLAGVQGVLTIRQLAVNTSGSIYKPLTSRPWPWFQRYNISNSATPATGTPTTWSQQSLGTLGTFGVSPIPTTSPTVQADCVCLPIPLVDDNTPECIPAPFTDAISYYAAYLAYLSSQKTQDATVMFQRYEQFVARAIQETAPAVLPMNYQGGRGAQIVASKQSLTQQSAKQGG